MLKALLSFLTAVAAKAIEGLVAQMQRDRSLKHEAVLEAQAKTEDVLKDIADARSQIRVAPDVDGLIKQLRDDANSGDR